MVIHPTFSRNNVGCMFSGTVSTAIFSKTYRITVHKIIIDTVYLAVCSVIGIKLAGMHFRANSIINRFPKIISDRKCGLETHCVWAVLRLSEHIDKLRIANSYPMNLRWDSFTLFWFTIAY